MPRPDHLPFQAGLTLLLALGVPLPLQAVSDGGGAGAQTAGQTADQTKQPPNPRPTSGADPLREPPPAEPGTTLPLTPATPAEPGPAADRSLDPRLTALEEQLQGLKQPQGFSLLKPPGSLLEILALAALPLSILALALALLQAQRNRRGQAAFHQRLKDLRQELNNRPNPGPLQQLPRQPVPVATPALAVGEEPPQALPVPDAPLPPPPAPTPPTIDTWISALNTGQRDNLRAHAAVQLNITKESEDAIQMGRSDATCLEEVAAGGSYLRVSDGTDHWLLPTERTLSSFRSFQPIKGLFTYQPMISGEPQLLQAGRLEPTANGWRVRATGVIRVAG